MWSAENEKYRLVIEDDQIVESPREWDNLGKMMCFHDRYSLGDIQGVGPRGEMAELAREYSKEALYKKIRGRYDLIRRIDNERGEESFFVVGPDWRGRQCDSLEAAEETLFDFVDDEMDEPSLSMDELLSIVEENVMILPLFLYDHSGISMRIGRFPCPWDSGQVGWIYVPHSKIKEEYGDLSHESLETARKVLKGEVNVYDLYIQGRVYSYVLEEKKVCSSCGEVKYEHIDSCGGFFGEEWRENCLLDTLVVDKEVAKELVEALAY